jgi:TolA-binding protein
MTMRLKKWNTIVSAAVLCIGLAGRVRADDKKADVSLAQYLEQLQTKLDHTARRVNQPNAEGSSVVGLRGSKQEAPSKQLYWKGKKGKEAVSPEEVKAFRAAVDQARAGKNADAITSLKTFQDTYPKSALLPDVNDTLARLNTTPTP